MSTDKPAKKARSSKATKADLEAKIAELEAKLNAVSSQLSKPAETKPAPAPQPKPAPAPQPKPEVKAPPPPAPEPSKPAEVAPAYSSTSSSGYTGNKYYATRQRLAYHPPDKQFRGQVAMTVQVAPPALTLEPEPQQVAEPEPAPKEEPRRIEPPVPRVKYTGDNYYRTRQRLAYHPPDKQFRETVAIKFDEPPTIEQVETASSHQEQQKATRSSDKRSRAEQLAEYEKEYLERLSRQPEPEPERVVETTKPRGTMPAGWKPS